MKIEDYKNIHFIGIGGVSMSGLAMYLKREGFIVTGSDRGESETTKTLESLGITVYIGHDDKNITDETEIVCFTSAISKDNPELVEAKRRGIYCAERAELLGKMMERFKYPLSIAGTHGKTTTTSLVSSVLLRANVDPTITVGGYLPAIDGNFKLGKNDYFVVETCEYCDNFLWLKPNSAIILNVELDHTDYFKSEEQYYESFNKFAKSVQKDGCVVINNGIKDYEKVIADVEAKVITIGFEDADYMAKNIEYNAKYNVFDIYRGEKFICKIETQVKGEHNVLNSLCTFALCDNLGIDLDHIIEGLKSFSGINRRLQFKGNINGVDIYDDYAHHPTEIKTTLKTVSNMGYNNIFVVFQPHTYSRTKSLLNDFSTSFSDATKAIFLDIYSAREAFDPTVSSEELSKMVHNFSNNGVYADSFESARHFVEDIAEPGDIVLTMGAGDVYKIADEAIESYEKY